MVSNFSWKVRYEPYEIWILIASNPVLLSSAIWSQLLLFPSRSTLGDGKQTSHLQQRKRNGKTHLRDHSRFHWLFFFLMCDYSLYYYHKLIIQPMKSIRLDDLDYWHFVAISEFRAFWDSNSSRSKCSEMNVFTSILFWIPGIDLPASKSVPEPQIPGELYNMDQ